ncbi:MAG: lytic transglycosylase domain-containing protein [Deltaproteobacteria bacterium]|nr:lytic transglycosylase domain-containing protein [Deltaproteobacteria bacterium]
MHECFSLPRFSLANNRVAWSLLIINSGVAYFKKLLNKFDGNVKLALAAYNAGTRKVRQYQGIPPYKATRYYIKKVFEYYQIYKKQMAGEPDRV